MKSGAGVAALQGAATYGGTTTVEGGTLQVNNTSGSGTGSGAVFVESLGTLAGTGSTGGPIVASDGGTVAPGIAAPQIIGTLDAPSVTFEAGSTLAVRLQGSGTGQFDRLAVSGSVSIDPAATLVVSTVGGFEPTPGDACPVDVDGDGIVADLLAVLGAFGDCPDCPADVTGDGVVNVEDLLSVLSAWGPCA